MLQKTASQTLRSSSIVSPKKRLTPVMRSLYQWAMVDANDRVLDLTCGDGVLLAAIDKKVNCHICGIAATNEQSRCARAILPNADILFAQIEDIPWHDEGFDVVMCGMPLYQMDNPERALKEAFRVLKPGGQFVMASPWYPSPLRQWMNHFSVKAEEVAGPICMDRHESSVVLEQIGFKKVSWRQAELSVGVTIGWKPKDMLDA